MECKESGILDNKTVVTRRLTMEDNSVQERLSRSEAEEELKFKNLKWEERKKGTDYTNSVTSTPSKKTVKESSDGW